MRYLFEETQKFTQWWLWGILLGPILISLIIDSKNVSNSYLVISGVIILFIYCLRLRIKIDQIGLHYQFSPFHLKSYTIKYDQIDKFEALTYNPIFDYGGWGIRYRMKGRAYNVKGNQGVKVYLKNGKNILFGSQRYKEFENALIQIQNLKKVI